MLGVGYCVVYDRMVRFYLFGVLVVMMEDGISGFCVCVRVRV